MSIGDCIQISEALFTDALSSHLKQQILSLLASAVTTEMFALMRMYYTVLHTTKQERKQMLYTWVLDVAPKKGSFFITTTKQSRRKENTAFHFN